MKKLGYKRRILRELWLNRPWVFLPAVIYWMREFPYDSQKDYFLNWLSNAIHLNWKYSFRIIYEED